MLTFIDIFVSLCISIPAADQCLLTDILYMSFICELMFHCNIVAFWQWL